MANVFLSGEDKDLNTAVMLERAIVHDIGKAVAYTDGRQVFLNTDDNLSEILPAYNNKMLKWLLWHERFHMELRHHKRYFDYIEELKTIDDDTDWVLDKSEVNIIMDILVHDSLSKMFPELVATAIENLAQMRNRNSLKYTFKTYTLEEMLSEYNDYKKSFEGEGEGKGAGKDKDTDGEKSDDTDSKTSSKDKPDEPPTEESKDDKGKKSDDKDTDEKGHGEGGKSGADDEHKDRPEDGEPDDIADSTAPELPDEHDKTDWSKLSGMDTKEFIDSYEADRYRRQIEELRNKKIKLARITETLNGLVTTTRERTYRMPSHIYAGKGVMLKGRMPGRARMYLCFDASGSMGAELKLFKEIISKSIPQAMNTPCEWFTYKYGKGTFKDFMPVYADSGFSDDGDRTIDLCWNAEQKGYSPIGVTDGGGCISWSKAKIKQLKRTVLVGSNGSWLRAVQKINPNIQIIEV